MPASSGPPTVGSPSDLLRALQHTERDLRERFKDDPLGLAEHLGLQMPEKPLQVMKRLGKYDEEIHGPILPGLRELVEDVCLGDEESAAVIGPRGGGKSMGVSYIEFFLVFLKKYDALNLGGSELQADQVYQYLLTYIDSSDYWKTLLKGEALQSKTTTVDGAWIRVLTASQKSVRSPHAGGKKKNGRMAGGILVIDEEAEADPDIVSAALPTINTARPSVNVRSSTFHNAHGSFAELIDSHVTMGYKLYSWDIFDVCERCDCVDSCQSEEPCFRDDHYETYEDPDTGELKQRLLHRAYCGGRAMYADGWVPVDEVHKMFRRMKRNHDKWEVEAMGSRPTTSGHVIKDRKKYAVNTVEETGEQLYQPGSSISICVDWGTVAAGITVWQEQFHSKMIRHALLHADLVQEAGPSQIIGLVLGYWNRYHREAIEVAADIGGGGNYMNPKLREEYRIPVRDVVFGEEKEAAVAAWNIFNEQGQCLYPAEHEDFHEQVKKWKRKNGRIVKAADHLPDSSICYFSKFIDRLGLSNVRVSPRTFSSSPSDGGQNQVMARVAGKSDNSRVPVRRPMMRSIGSRRR